MKRMTAVLAALLALSAVDVHAQHYVLHANLVQPGGHVVGGAEAVSGLNRWKGDTSWVHIGWDLIRSDEVAYDPEDPDYLFMVGGNGALRSLDGGESWRITTDWRVTEVKSLAMDPLDTDNVYIGSGYGIWRTHDRGDTWIESNEGIETTFTDALEIDRSESAYLIAGTEGGLYRSENQARSWTQVGPERRAVRDLSQSRTHPERWIAGTQGGGVLVSNDGGRTWRYAEGAIEQEIIYSVSIDPNDPDRMVAGSWGNGVYLSTDGGVNWHRTDGEVPGGEIYSIAVDPDESGRVWAGTFERGLYFSDDDGASWEYAGLHDTIIFNLSFLPR